MEVRYSAEADEDIDEAWFSLETSRPGEGERFHADIRATLAYIELWPRGFQISSVRGNWLQHRLRPLRGRDPAEDA